MSMSIQTDAPPLRRDEIGALRVGESRVLLELIIYAFQDGETPEEIVQAYPTTTLSDIYTVVGYYLRHRDEVDEYLKEREQMAAEVRERIEARQGDLAELRRRLLRRRDG
jgi:uncharacterized protein (DUF433 family)